MSAYRTSKSVFYETPAHCCAVDESAALKLEFINKNLKDIAEKMLEAREISAFMGGFGCTKPQAIFELGAIPGRDVLNNITFLEGYYILHKALKVMNADFRFQILPSAGMMRPMPVLLIIIESFRNYASNMTEKNRHMYPGFSANDNGGCVQGKAALPLTFNFS